MKYAFKASDGSILWAIFRKAGDDYFLSVSGFQPHTNDLVHQDICGRMNSGGPGGSRMTIKEVMDEMGFIRI